MQLSNTTTTLLTIAALCGALAASQSIEDGEVFSTEYIFETQVSSLIEYVTMTGAPPSGQSPPLVSTEILTQYPTAAIESNSAPLPTISSLADLPDPETAELESVDLASPSSDGSATSATVLPSVSSLGSSTESLLGSAISPAPTISGNVTGQPSGNMSNQPTINPEPTGSGATGTKLGATGVICIAAALVSFFL